MQRGISKYISPRHAARLLKKGISNRIWSALGCLHQGIRTERKPSELSVRSISMCLRYSSKVSVQWVLTNWLECKRSNANIPVCPLHLVMYSDAHLNTSVMERGAFFWVGTSSPESWWPRFADLRALRELFWSICKPSWQRIRRWNAGTALVAQLSGIDKALGWSGEDGILALLSRRAAFLSDPTHTVVFHYTPNHSSWMNQIEIWLSILVRKVLKRGSLASVEALEAKVLAFIDDYNQTAKPFKWT